MPADKVHCPACHDPFDVAPGAQTATCPRCQQSYRVMRQSAPVVLLQEPRRPPAAGDALPGATILMWLIGIGTVLFLLFAISTGG